MTDKEFKPELPHYTDEERKEAVDWMRNLGVQVDNISLEMLQGMHMLYWAIKDEVMRRCPNEELFFPALMGGPTTSRRSDDR